MDGCGSLPPWGAVVTFADRAMCEAEWTELDKLRAENEGLRERVRLHELAVIDCPGGEACMCDEIEEAQAILAELAAASDENEASV